MPRQYSRSAGREVAKEMREFKRGKLKSGQGGKGGKVKSRKQAIAIGLSKARKEGAKVPSVKNRSTTTRSKSGAAKKTKRSAGKRLSRSR